MRGRPCDRGAWFLVERGFAPITPEQLIPRLLARLPREPVVSESLSADYDVRLSIAVHFTGWNKGFELPADLIAKLGATRLAISFDLYPYGDEDA